MDLFEHANEQGRSDEAPLAEKLRPTRRDQLILRPDEEHQVHLVLRRVQKIGRLPNLLLWGPPGSGKTTLARLLSGEAKAAFLEVNASDAGAKRLKEISEESRVSTRHGRQPTVLFLDEIHRLNRAQQDVLLPYTESGRLTLLGATTENPASVINRALLSRCMILSLKPKAPEDFARALDRAIESGVLKGLNDLSFQHRIELSNWAAGDFRAFWNLCEQLEATSAPEQLRELSGRSLEELLPRPSLASSSPSSNSNDYLSAMIKSIRGTDPDAAVYYLTCLIEGGEDPERVARRLIVSASEDIGNANPEALQLAVAGAQALERVGLPEASICLSQVAIYLAVSPKSNSCYRALQLSQEEIRSRGRLDPPRDLMSNSELDSTCDYRSPHNSPSAYISRSHLPKEIQSLKIYEPSTHGEEVQIKDWLKKIAIENG